MLPPVGVDCFGECDCHKMNYQAASCPFIYTCALVTDVLERSVEKNMWN